ncbi:hypothetical protein T310_3779 [Rasamsonia emersonii CBS 393.64]|uniref:DDE-1 domain-containing protein n=1 Tax=Rasamsonia emersonii (strain ATCC 16479 / CBS 393.64 / IMI 116815) TaxID=1408163 RepID=A0A0F4YVV1_RASE3|nr:hypothetical protein T310_3779 [Rasamsonia emersonii CBS 393.64]KKA22215.1 hypothetical protein T310_3779 [Rasamsonia emersonii CBS 393.64]
MSSNPNIAADMIINGLYRVLEAVQKYGITKQDIYNFDETGFSMGMISTAKVVTGSESRGRPKAIQPGNREWVTVIEAINAAGWALPPMIIFAGKNHQSNWYPDLPKGWAIGTSNNGWTTDELGMLWLRNVFDKHTKACTAGKYRLLILDGHSSHISAEFDQFCTENMIIPLYLPPHSSHLLQPLDVACFGPLKHAYGQQIQIYMQHDINHIDKEDFITIYQQVRPRALTASNICSGFAASGLVPYKPEQVLDQLHIQLKTPTPPGTSHSNQLSSWTAETPKNARELEKQSELIKRLWRQHTRSPPSPISQAVDQVVKGCQIAMNNAVLLEHEIKQLRVANQRQKRQQETARSYIATGGILTAEEGQQLAQQAAELQAEVADQADMQPRRRAPPRCSNCNIQGRTRVSCPSK